MPTTYAIPDGRTVMAATTWTSVGGAETISNAVNGVSFQPDFLWMKNRTISQNNYLVDSNRGTSKILVSNTTTAEVTDATFVTAFNSNGFSLGAGGFAATQAIVGWQWKEGATQGFDIVSQTLGTTGINTITHNLGVVPTMVLAKKTSAGAEQWLVYHASGTTQSQYLGLNTTAGASTSANIWGSSVFTTTQIYFSGTSGNTYVFYIFAPVAGYSAFGSYTGNLSTDGPFVYTGFRPRFILTKNSSLAGGNWFIQDTSRGIYNAVGNSGSPDSPLAPNTTGSETDWNGTFSMDILSNGFKIRNTAASMNTSGETYIYYAVAENPFKYANAR
jgi:hypothetical protein